MSQMPNLSPPALFVMVRVTLLVLLGRRPATGSFDASPQGPMAGDNRICDLYYFSNDLSCP